MKLAKNLRDRAMGVTETYIAYDATEKLYKRCAAQAPYSVPQAHNENRKTGDVEIPESSDGVQQGVGEGWWYQGSLYLSFSFLTSFFLHLHLLSSHLPLLSTYFLPLYLSSNALLSPPLSLYSAI